LYLLIGMTGLPPQVNSLSLHLVQKIPVRSVDSIEARIFSQDDEFLSPPHSPPAGSLIGILELCPEWFVTVFVDPESAAVVNTP
jgi:hypothetical protein